jgi:hypothetical protein
MRDGTSTSDVFETTCTVNISPGKYRLTSVLKTEESTLVKYFGRLHLMRFMEVVSTTNNP